MNYSKDSKNGKNPEGDSKKRKIKSRISIIIFRIFFISFLIIFFAGAGAGLGLLSGIIKATPPIDVNDIVPEGYKSYLLDDKGNQVAELTGAEANREWVDLENIPLSLQQAYIAMEDERFYEHNGIDLQAILRAVMVNLKSRSFGEGGSTLTQQLIKNNVLGTSKKTFVRKIQEQYIALKLEQELVNTLGKKKAKDKILENYLNTVNLNGAFGVKSATEQYFGKDNLDDLTVAEAATLVAITPNPSRYDPTREPEGNDKMNKNQQRQVVILKKMMEQGFIDENAYTLALAEKTYENIQSISESMKDKKSFNSYFTDAVYEALVKDLVALGYPENQASNLIYRGGLKIYTTQDTQMQTVLEEEMLDETNFPDVDYAVLLDYAIAVKHTNGETENFFNPSYNNPWGAELFKTKEKAEAYIAQFKKEKLVEGDEIIVERIEYTPQPQASMVIMDYRTGQVKALVGGRGEKKGNRTLNRATNTTRQPGSTFKILSAYAPAMDTAGYTPATIIDDAPFTVINSNGTSYDPKNWYHTKRNKYWYRGLSTVREGIVNSMNILAVKTIYDIGLPTAFDYLKSFGFTTIGGANNEGYAMSLGGLSRGVTNLELTAAFGSIANSGVYTEPLLYTKVIDHNGNILIDKQPETHTVIKDTTAFLLTDMMKDVVVYGTGTKARFQNVYMPVAGKTGTTQESRDLWFSGYTPYYAASVWTGFDKQTSIKDNVFHLKLWRKVMEKIHEEKQLPFKEFTEPPGITPAYIDTESGKLAGPLSEQDPRGSTARWEKFAVGTVPTETDDVHVAEKICTVSGLFATEYCPADTVVTKVFIKRPESMRLDYEKLTPEILAHIQDYQYELPHSMEGEYCPIHGPRKGFTNPFDGDISIPLPPGFDFEPGTPPNSNGINKSNGKKKNKKDNTEVGNKNNETPPSLDNYLFPPN